MNFARQSSWLCKIVQVAKLLMLFTHFISVQMHHIKQLLTFHTNQVLDSHNLEQWFQFALPTVRHVPMTQAPKALNAHYVTPQATPSMTSLKNVMVRAAMLWLGIV